MPELPEQGVGKCAEHHLGSYGFPTRPEEPYDFCPRCGNRMVWACARCNATLPDDPEELETANFCRSCGAPYFEGVRA
jgi:predicted RNA-binding Zn-ribbon protein involved in translation (DUF1610 family)